VVLVAMLIDSDRADSYLLIPRKTDFSHVQSPKSGICLYMGLGMSDGTFCNLLAVRSKILSIPMACSITAN
jgi:hypothetical protein